MSVLISDDRTLVGTLDPKYKDGVIWITVPAAEEAVGPILLTEYLAHQTNARSLPALTALASKRGDMTKLTPCGASDDQAASSGAFE